MSNGHETKNPPPPPPPPPPPAGTGPGGVKPNDGSQIPPQKALRKAAGVGGAIGGVIGASIRCSQQHLRWLGSVTSYQALRQPRHETLPVRGLQMHLTRW